MPKTLFIKDIKDGTSILSDVFSVREVQLHKTRNGDPYYRISLQDKTGHIHGKLWKDSFSYCDTKVIVGDVVTVTGTVTSYNNELQLTITAMQKTEDYSISDLVKMTGKDVSSMWQELLDIANSLEDKSIVEFLTKLLSDEKVANAYKNASAAEKVHHDYVGGLLEHVLEIIKIADSLITIYPMANRSIVVAGSILHDIGKLEEFAIKDTTIIRTKQGYLLGHIIIGLKMIQSYYPKSLSADVRTAIEHIIISHHEEPEYGALVRPSTIEAEIVAVSDMASSKVRQFQKELAEGTPDFMGFGEYHKFLKTKIYHATETKELPAE